ncbi:MAG: hypothetical protein KKF46_07420 [Nanoarchaeota archaeon]|nr:hypothetical protein [Nanoarchaeota archaeon]MBU1322157.1 hypothetical protein [Nanoarchaeota archaeon]MBU1597878.1 hypothetical protein [Nanoarchaeota archaeon]MBU2441297.1 hypothetical protein [Nanoarchaeota archaeon]
MLKKIIPVILILLLAVSLVAAASYTYMPNVRPHTRYNPLRYSCYYYYGYGSCQVDNAECRGVSIGKNKWVDLGDACNRNEAPIMTGLQDITVTETEFVKINAKCLDQDPVEISYSGWIEQAETLTTYKDAGEHKVTVTCTDSFGEKVIGVVKITVQNKNRAPLFSAFGFDIE